MTHSEISRNLSEASSGHGSPLLYVGIAIAAIFIIGVFITKGWR